MTHDEEEEQPHVHVVMPAYELRWEDFIGTGLHMIAGVGFALGQGLQMMGNEFFAAARYRRIMAHQRLEREAWDRQFNGIISQPVLTEGPEAEDE